MATPEAPKGRSEPPPRAASDDSKDDDAEKKTVELQRDMDAKRELLDAMDEIIRKLEETANAVIQSLVR